jgi:hypothetical protein
VVQKRRPIDHVDFRPITRPGYRVPDRIAADSLTEWLRDALTGREHVGAPAVVWEDRDARVLLHVAKLQVRTAKTALVVAIDTETEEFGVAPLVVRFVFGTARSAAALVAATDEEVLGHPQVAARWGELFRSVIWAAIVRLSEAHAGERGQRPRSMSILGDHLRLASEPPVDVAAIARAHVDGAKGAQAQ